MEEKRRDASNSPAAPNSADGEPSTRRRAGALKRKANSLSASSPSSLPSKRASREKSSLLSQSAILHNGPLTRARQGAPGNLSPFGSGRLKLDEPGSAREKARLEELEEANKVNQQWEALEAKIEAEFESIRSRESNAHVVPNHCGWFSWTKIHHLEKRMLPTFFNGKVSNRTPDIYLEIRNWIMKKFHVNPNTQIELKDLSELEVGEMDARQEVMEFLDYWGLINFHPFPPADSTTANAVVNEAAKNDSLIEKLYRFEAVESSLPVIHKPSLTTPSLPSGLFPESAAAEDLGIPEGPSVEYHCNSCSGDCSRKRYHCQKQADFDLCTDCFSNGKFGSGMSSADFILMESAEAPGLSSGKWTDQETLLLLEALELFKENWSEIAEHVATKTKAQCILHFVQMPIEDSFLDLGDDTDPNPKETGGPAATDDETNASKDVPEATESKTSPNDGQAQASPMEISKPDDASEMKISEELPKTTDKSDEEVCLVKSKTEDTSEVKVSHQDDENLALKALKEAFEAVGYSLTPEYPLSFADVGNPVMALAGFLARLVEPGSATASTRSSLKSISGNTPGVQLASRHCFLLEDPPDDKKEQPGSESNVNGLAGREEKNGGSQEDDPKEDKSVPDIDQRNPSSNPGGEETEASVSEEKTSSASPNDQSSEKKEPDQVAAQDVKDASLKETPKGSESSVVKDSDGLASQVPPTSAKGSGGEEIVDGERSQSKEAVKDVDMSDSLPSKKNEPGEATVQKENGEEAGVDSTDMEPTQPADTSKDVDMMLEPQQQVTPNSENGKGVTTEENQLKEVKKDDDNAGDKDDQCFDKLKRAAVTAISAAAVKAKLLADEEEETIKQLAASVIEKQLLKLETKLTFFNEMESVTTRVKEQLDRSRQRLYHERAQIIAARLGLPASSSRATPPTPANRIATNYASSIARPPMGMTSPRPPMSRPMGPMTPPSNSFPSTTMAGSSIRPAS